MALEHSLVGTAPPPEVNARPLLGEVLAAHGFDKRAVLNYTSKSMQLNTPIRSNCHARICAPTAIATTDRLDHDPKNACPGLDPERAPVFRKDHAPGMC